MTAPVTAAEIDTATEPVAPTPDGGSNGRRPWRKRVGSLAREYRPSVVTGGAATAPLLVLALMNAADELDREAFGVLLPEIRDYFGVSLGVIITVATMSAVLPIVLSVPIGFLADRWNRTRMIAGGSAVWGVFTVMTAFATNLPMLGFARFGSGVGKTMEPAATSLLADYYPPDRRAGIFAFHRLGNEMGLLIAPLLAGVLAQVFFWQVPFLLFGIPSVALAIVALLRLREPRRGIHERRLLGIEDEELLMLEEKPPGWSEGWRLAKGVRTLRRIWASLPFMIGALVVIFPMTAVYYADEFNLSESARGSIGSFSRFFGIAGLVIGGVVGNRLLARNPARLVTYAGLLSLVHAGMLFVLAASPWLWLSVLAGYLGTMASSVLFPSTMALVTMVIPARARSFAGAFASLFIALGAMFSPFAGMLADRFGPRTAIICMVPVFAIGALIMTSAGASVLADIRAATAAAAASQAVMASRRQGTNALLVCRDLDVHYGQVQILFNVDFEVEEGEIVALMGTNGAGKSTLLNAIGGVVAASNGAIFFDGFDVTFLPPNDHVQAGIAQVPGGKGVFPTLTVRENLQLAQWSAAADQSPEALEEVLTTFPRLRERLGEAAGSLSGGEQQMLALGQAFLARPRLLLIDELSLGLAPAVVEQLLEIVRAIHRRGTTIVLVEQSVNVALTLAHRAVFMEKGEVRFSGPTAELLERGDILRSVFLAGSASAEGTYGSRRAAVRPGGAPGDRKVVLRVDDVHKRFGGVAALAGASIELREGETIGLIGPNGAGKTTLFDVVSGFVVPDSGTVELLGTDVTDLAPDERAALGLARSFQDARLYPALTVTESLLVALDRHSGQSAGRASLGLPGSRRSEARLRVRADRLIALMNLGEFRDKFVRELSTGSRRLVDLACVLAADPHVLLLDEPSSGIAQKETEEMAPLLQRIKAETGCSVLIIEHDMQLISAVSDELVAMELGADLVRGDPSEVLSDPRVVESYLGTSQEAINRSGHLPAPNSGDGR